MKFLLLLLTVIVACGDSTSPSTPDADVGQADADVGHPDARTLVNRVYEHALFDDPGDCPDDPLFNCTATLELCADGSATMLLTDILNGGTYTWEGNTIVTMWGPGEAPSQVTFTASVDDTILIDDWQSWQWSVNAAALSGCD